MENPLSHINTYEIEQLLAHAEEGCLVDEIHRLLRLETVNGSNAWYDIKLKKNNIIGYIEDINRAWRISEKTLLKPEKRVQSVSLLFRYALIITSQNKLIENLPSTLLIALVKKGHWSPKEGLDYLETMSNDWKKSQVLKELVPYLPKEQIQRSYRLAQNLSKYDHYAAFENCFNTVVCSPRSNALACLLKYLPKQLVNKTWNEIVVNIQEIKGDIDRILAFDQIIPILPDLLKRQILGDVLSVMIKISYYNHERIEYLNRFPGYFPELIEESNLDKILYPITNAESLDKEHFDSLLECIRKVIFKTAQKGNIDIAISSSLFLLERGFSEKPLIEISQYLHEKLLKNTLSQTERFSKKIRERIWIGLIPRLIEIGCMNEAKKLFQNVSSPEIWVKLLVKIFNSFSTFDQTKLQEKALSKIQSIKNRQTRIHLLIEISKIYSEDGKESVLQKSILEIYALTGNLRKIKSFFLVLPCVKNQQPLIQDIFDLISKTKRREEKVEHLIELSEIITHRNKSILEEAIKITFEITNYSKKLFVIEMLLPHLNETLLSKVFNRIGKFKNDWYRVRAFIKASD
jgi:hypothetical protein